MVSQCYASLINSLDQLFLLYARAFKELFRTTITRVLKSHLLFSFIIFIQKYIFFVPRTENIEKFTFNTIERKQQMSTVAIFSNWNISDVLNLKRFNCYIVIFFDSVSNNIYFYILHIFFTTAQKFEQWQFWEQLIKTVQGDFW